MALQCPRGWPPRGGLSTHHEWNNMRTCDIAGCNDPHNAKGMCLTHYHRIRRNGTLERRRPRQDGEHNHNYAKNPKYTTIHTRLSVLRGKASTYDCVDCGGPAQDWAYTNDCPNELRQDKFGPYSADLSRYQPMCRLCHKAFDMNAGLVPA